MSAIQLFDLNGQERFTGTSFGSVTVLGPCPIAFDTPNLTTAQLGASVATIAADSTILAAFFTWPASWVTGDSANVQLRVWPTGGGGNDWENLTASIVDLTAAPPVNPTRPDVFSFYGYGGEWPFDYVIPVHVSAEVQVRALCFGAPTAGVADIWVIAQPAS